MSEPPDLLRSRFDMVARLSEITSQLQKLHQSRMSAEMNVQRIEMTPDGAAGDLQEELSEAHSHLQAADEAIAGCEARLAEIEARLDETDREIAALSGRQTSP